MAFLWLGLALLVDGLDGTIARKIGVSDKAPNIDGSTLDNLIDYLNYVIIPSLMIYWFQMVPNGWEIISLRWYFCSLSLHFCKYKYENKRLLFQWFSSFMEYSCLIFLYFKYKPLY